MTVVLDSGQVRRVLELLSGAERATLWQDLTGDVFVSVTHPSQTTYVVVQTHDEDHPATV